MKENYFLRLKRPGNSEFYFSVCEYLLLLRNVENKNIPIFSSRNFYSGLSFRGFVLTEFSQSQQR